MEDLIKYLYQIINLVCLKLVNTKIHLELNKLNQFVKVN